MAGVGLDSSPSRDDANRLLCDSTGQISIPLSVALLMYLVGLSRDRD